MFEFDVEVEAVVSVVLVVAVGVVEVAVCWPPLASSLNALPLAALAVLAAGAEVAAEAAADTTAGSRTMIAHTQPRPTRNRLVKPTDM